VGQVNEAAGIYCPDGRCGACLHEEAPAEEAERDLERPPNLLSKERAIPTAWIDGVAALDRMRSPTHVPRHRWQLFLADCNEFMLSSQNWAERAARLGWNALTLFGCHRIRPLEHLGNAGLLWVINGGKLVELYRDWAVIERVGDLSRHVHHRRSPRAENMALPWSGAQFSTPRPLLGSGRR